MYSFSIPIDSLGIPRPIEILCTETKPDDQANEGRLSCAGFTLCGTLPNGHRYWRQDTNVTVSTALPNLVNLPAVRYSSERLIFRSPVVPSDVEALYSLRKQPEPMRLLERPPDENSEESRAEIERDDYSLTRVIFVIFLKEEDGREGELIGKGGVNAFYGYWPTLFYVFKKEHWGCGYGTEFVKAFLEFWSSLPRRVVELRVPLFTVDLGETPRVTGILLAAVDEDNERSQKVVRKVGFERCGYYDRTRMICFRYPPSRRAGRSLSLFRRAGHH